MTRSRTSSVSPPEFVRDALPLLACSLAPLTSRPAPPANHLAAPVTQPDSPMNHSGRWRSPAGAPVVLDYIVRQSTAAPRVGARTVTDVWMAILRRWYRAGQPADGWVELVRRPLVHEMGWVDTPQGQIAGRYARDLDTAVAYLRGLSYRWEYVPQVDAVLWADIVEMQCIDAVEEERPRTMDGRASMAGVTRVRLSEAFRAVLALPGATAPIDVALYYSLAHRGLERLLYRSVAAYASLGERRVRLSAVLDGIGSRTERVEPARAKRLLDGPRDALLRAGVLSSGARRTRAPRGMAFDPGAGEPLVRFAFGQALSLSPMEEALLARACTLGTPLTAGMPRHTALRLLNHDREALRAGLDEAERRLVKIQQVSAQGTRSAGLRNPAGWLVRRVEGARDGDIASGALRSAVTP